ncbi:hypothetical protein LGH82_23555 [Mesorhizobium sp. PAMC28654]|uniref:hypothetical protein n=1 Tax=Mesorhizobium sp. PAMC28654 TaxID=2880934 RepID=UPI001D0ACD52|nr:hypothetical protein [Mesorhizobium sp. PAMC28654]UDL88113.1 hypothetical protein LGH82_23555 [Mesorhizobium sp. PAMC28654]
MTSSIVENIMGDAFAGAAYADDPSLFANVNGIGGFFGELVRRAAAKAAATGRAVEIAPGVTVRITSTSPPLIDVCAAPGVDLNEVARGFRSPPNGKTRRSGEKRRAQ